MLDTQATQKLQKVRTFAQDAEQAQNADQTAVSIPPKEAEDQSDKEIAQTKNDASIAIPPPPPTTPDVNQTTQTTKKDPDNPPFHTLQKSDKQAEYKIPESELADLQESAKHISDGPSSHLASDQTDPVDIDNDDSATIISDTKHTRKGLWQAIAESTSAWFNSFTTPAKPSYTVSSSQRRAGIVKNATTRTGSENVSYDDFAARLRARFATPTEQQTADTSHTDPVFLPELPPHEQAQAQMTDIEAVPRKSSNVAIPPPQPTSRPKATTEELEDVQETSSTTNVDGGVSTEKPQEKAVERKPVRHDSVQPDTQEPKVKKPTLPAPETATMQPASATPAVVTTEQSTTQTEPESVAIASTEEDESTATTPNQAAENEKVATVTDLEIPTREETTVDTTTPEPVAAPETVPAYSEAPSETTDPIATREEAVPKPEYTDTDITEVPEQSEPTTEEPVDEQSAVRSETNRLSVLVVASVLGLVILGYIVTSIFSLVAGSQEGLSITHTIPNSTIETIQLAAYPDSATRFARVLEISEQADVGEIIQIIPTIQSQNTQQEASSGTTFDAFNLQAPSSFQETVVNIYFGGMHGVDPYVLFITTDRSVARGGLLSWEPRMPAQFTPLFGTASGSFQDTSQQGYDLRTITTNEQSIITYGLWENRVIVTTTPDAWIAIIEQLR